MPKIDVHGNNAAISVRNTKTLPRLFLELFGASLGARIDPKHLASLKSHEQVAILEDVLPHLKIALTHRSAVLEDPTLTDNERLEFLGDALIASRVSDVLYHKFLDRDEGHLTLLRASLVNTDALAKLAHDMRLDLFLLLGQGERLSGGSTKRTILSGTFEAVVASVHLDLSLDHAAKLIDATVLSEVDQLEVSSALLDSKSALQIALAKSAKSVPVYTTSKAGPDHVPVFVTEVHIGEAFVFEGSGRSKKESQQAAAKQALAHLSHVSNLDD